MIQKKLINVAWHALFDPPPGPTDLHLGESVAVRLEGFPAGSAIDKVIIYDDDGGKPGPERCSWTRSGGNKCQMYGIVAPSEIVVTLTDNQQNPPAGGARHWFRVSGTLGEDLPWELDPELINRPGN